MSDARARALESTQKDIRQEGAATLRRAGEQLQAAIDTWRAAEASGARDEPALRQHAADRLWVMIVQREAVGIGRHDDLYEAFAIPKTLVPRMRPKVA